MFFSNRYFKVQNLAILKMKYNYIISNCAQNMRFKKIPNEIKFFGLELVSFILSKSTLQMFAGIYGWFIGKSECGDFKFMGIACYPQSL